MIIQVKTIPRDSATRVHEIKNVLKGPGKSFELGETMNKTKVHDSCKDTYHPLISRSSGRILTGLNKVVPNPYYLTNKKGEYDEEASAKKLLKVPRVFHEVAKQPEILLQHLLEIKHGRQFDEYTDIPNKSSEPGRQTFFQTFRWKLNDGSTFFDLDRPEDELAYHCILASKYIANSPQERAEHRWPEATHIVVSESETEKQKAQKSRIKAQAKAKVLSLTPSDQAKIVKIMKLGQGHLTEDQTFNLLSSYVDKSNPDKDEKIKTLNQWLDKFETAPGREEIEAFALLRDLVQNRIVSNRNETYHWNSENRVIGQREAEAVDFLLDPGKAPDREVMEKELRARIMV